MINFEHLTATSEEEALAALAGKSGTNVIAGGTDLLVLMKEGLSQPERLVDIKSIEGLHGIATEGEGLRIGALVTLSELEESAQVRQGYSALSQAAGLAASPQLRNMATIGGNLLQRPRCWYFRGDYPCWLKGGVICYAVQGENHHHAILDSGPCVAVHPSDLAPALIALESSVRTQASGGGRTLLLEEFCRNPTPDRRIEHDLQPGELITSIDVPAQPAGARSIYLKAMEREAWAFAVVSVAARLAVESGVVRDIRIVLGGVANTPYRSAQAEAVLAGNQLSGEVIEQAAAAAVEGARPLKDNSYKVALTRNLVRRALTSLAE